MTYSPMISTAGSVPVPAGAAPIRRPWSPVRPPPPITASAPASPPSPGPRAVTPIRPPIQAATAADPATAAIPPTPAAPRHRRCRRACVRIQLRRYAADSGQEADPEAPWPHQSFLELAALPTAAPCARLHTTLVLWEWDLGALVQTAALVVAELVSNAVQASLGLTGSRFAGHWAPGTPPVRIWLSADEERVVIQVWDGSDRPPVPQPVEPEADSGRGLLLVGALSAEWGCYTPDKSSGKVVWAVVAG